MQLRIEKCVIDLYWEYDRMSSSGQATLDRLAKMVGVPTEANMDKKFDHLSKDQLLKELEEL
tara:strand:+ start:1044 stop:1229 length:186 start_codon:yes stop_codon:yes gene_type:complete